MNGDFAGNDYPNPDNFPFASFPQEVPPPASESDAGDLITVQYSQNWADVLSAAVDQLLQFSSWEGDDDQKRLAVMRANNLKSALRRVIVTEGCVLYSNRTTFIEWFPNNPFTSPNLVPEGYNQPPWWIAQGTINEPVGSEAGDVLTDITRFPPGSLPTILPASGLPRFRINVIGTGTVRINLCNIALGSLIQTTVDDNILTLQIVDTELDIISLPPESENDVWIERELTTAGAHHIDCIVVSKVNDEFPFLYHGGGLRQLELCGVDIVPDYVTTPVRFNPATCQFEQSLDGGGTWSAIEGTEFITDCFLNQAAADDLYVNETGDTMSGTLTFANPALPSVETPIDITRYGVGSIFKIQNSASQGRILAQSTNNIVLGHVDGARLTVRSSNLNFLGNNALGLQSGSAFIFYGPQSQLTEFKASASSVVNLWRGLDENGVMVAALERSGVIHAGPGLIQGLLSNAAIWRDAAKWVSSWREATDATRLGRTTLYVHDYTASEEVLDAWANGPGLMPALAFRGLTPVDIPTYAPETPATAIFGVIDALNAQGLLDLEITYGIPAEAQPANNLEQCRMAWAIVNNLLKAYLESVLDNILTLTPEELVALLLSNFNVSSVTAAAIIAETWLFVTTGGDLQDVQDDLDANLDLLMSSVYDLAALTKAEVIAVIDASIPWSLALTEGLMIDVINGMSDELWISLLQTSVLFPAGTVCDQVAPCDGTIDFRFDPLWAEIMNGTLTPGVGLDSVVDGNGNYYASAAVVFEDCLNTDFTVTWWNNGDAPLGIVWGQQTWSGTAWEGAISSVPPGAVSGENTVLLQIGGSGLRRMVVQTQARNDVAHINRLIKFEWTPQ